MTENPERSVLVQAMAKQRSFLRRTITGITDEQAATRATVSELCLGGIVKHVSEVERMWARFVVEGPSVIGDFAPEKLEAHAATFRMEPGETVAGLLAEYEQVATETEKTLWDLETLDAEQPLPKAPWFPPGASWSGRQVFLHILAETAQHSGHADIIREALDGSKTMG